MLFNQIYNSMYNIRLVVGFSLTHLTIATVWVKIKNLNFEKYRD